MLVLGSSSESSEFFWFLVQAATEKNAYEALTYESSTYYGK
jgi:hypothetical protein